MYRKFVWAGAAVLMILIIGSIGYWLLSGQVASVGDGFYMTVITITTVGYGEVVELEGAARAFTIFIAIAGISTLFYIITNFTALIIEGELTKSFRRRKMEKIANKSEKHYIVCGIGTTGIHIVKELQATKRPHVLVDTDECLMEEISKQLEGEIYIIGDASDNDTLVKAGIEHAKGVFAVTKDDNQNLVIGLSAKQLNPKIKVVSRCRDTKNVEKMKLAGADAVICPHLIGGMRMTSEMVRPTVVSFLDMMLRDTEKNLRVEEVPIPDTFAGKDLMSLNLKKYRNIVLLAMKSGGDWIYNPPENHVIKSNETLVIMTTPEEGHKLEKVLEAAKA
ncbi:MAG: potassium channel protein [Chloroflexi bacterium]|jgi:voltage-gated potassium channel|nr:potassium channel protein [Chloroflexota bacterium]MBT7081573.1 potassium channel protein [Chloroflexota bacterium]MBT7288973.1 potassium channel protein [Chloroflexota bacterium]